MKTIFIKYMKASISSWGNSLAVRIPKAFAKQIGIAKGSDVEIMIQEDKIILSKPKFSLSNLTKDISQKNIHTETDTGNNVGKEIW